MKRTAQKIALLCLASVAMVGISGCGGDAPVSGLTDASTNFTLGQSSLNAALQLPQTTNPVPALAQAVYRLNAAYSQGPTPQRAAALAVASTAKVSAEIANLFGTTVTREAHPVTRFSDDLRIWNAGGELTQKLNPKSWLRGLWGEKKASRAYPSDPTPAQLRGALGAVETDLRRVCDVLSDANIAALEADPLLMDDPTSSDAGKQVRVGASEAYQIRAMSKAMLGFINFVQAYEYGYPETYNYDESLLSAFGSAANGASFAGSTFLPSAPFGALRGDGRARLQRMITDWSGVSADTVSASTTFTARTPSGSGERPWLSEVTSFGDLNQTELRAEAAEFGAALRGPAVIDGTTVNLPAFASNAPALGSLITNFTLSKSGSSYTFTPVGTTTFGGLFPSGASYSPVTLSDSKSRLDLLTEILAGLETSGAN